MSYFALKTAAKSGPRLDLSWLKRLYSFDTGTFSQHQKTKDLRCDTLVLLVGPSARDRSAKAA